MPDSIGVGAGSRTREAPQPLRTGLPLIGVLTAAAVGVTAAVTAAGAHATVGVSGGVALVEAIARGLIVGIPLAVALYACSRPAHIAFGRVFLAASGVWFLASLATSSSPALYSTGRVSEWVFEILLAYTVLAFPGGRLTAKFDRVVIAVAVVVVVALYLPSALFEQFPSPSATSICTAGCPHNAFMVVASQPKVMGSFVNPARELITALLFIVVAARLGVRIRTANSLMRRILLPVLAVMIGRILVFVGAFGARRAAPGSDVTQTLAWMLSFAVPILALAFLAGLLRWYVFVNTGVRIVNSRLREMPGPQEVRDLLGSAFDDLKLQIASWSPGRHQWIGVAGEPLDEPAPGSGRYLTDVGDGRRRVAIIHDGALRDDPMFIEAAAAAASVAFESDRVATQTTRIVGELQASRARVAAAADEERRRIERDLHDGAQQRLVGLCIHLQLAAERAEREHPEEALQLLELAEEVDQALNEMRSLTHEIYPATLLDGGLEDAVRSAAWRSPVHTTVEVDRLGEYPREIATAVYFCCVEALQNIAKHARDARSAKIVLQEAGSVLRFSVCDDGPGMSDSKARVGAGLINMEDRVSTVGGHLTIRSRAGQGTCVSGRIPLAALSHASGPRSDQRRASRLSPRRRDHLSK